MNGFSTLPNLRLDSLWPFRCIWFVVGTCCWRSRVHRSCFDCKKNCVVQLELDVVHRSGSCWYKDQNNQMAPLPCGWHLFLSALPSCFLFHIYQEENYISVSLMKMEIMWRKFCFNGGVWSFHNHVIICIPFCNLYSGLIVQFLTLLAG